MAQSPTSLFNEILGRQDWGDRPAILGDTPWSYGQMLACAEALAADLKAMGAGPNTMVAMSVQPTALFPAALLAIASIDAVIVPINVSASDDEKSYFLENASVRYVVTDTPETKLDPILNIQQARTSHGLRLLEIAPTTDQMTTLPGDRLIIHTSGSTTRPKGVVLTDSALSANVRAVADDLSLAPGDRAILYTPTAFAYAINQVLAQLSVGGSVLLWAHGLMFPSEILKAIDTHRITCLPANVPSLKIWTTDKTSQRFKLDSVRYIISAGQHLYSPLARATMAMFPNTRIVNPYGCSENSPRISHYWMPIEIPDRNAPWPVGRALDGVEVKVVDEQGNPVPRGGSGEILVRGTSLMRGYLRLNTLTTEKLSDGWYHTGDRAVLDEDGYLVLVGRLDNIFSVGHEKVAPEEVEAVIEQVNGITGSGIGPMPDPILENACCAIISVSGDSTEVTERVIRTCREKLTVAKIPKQVIVVDEVPKTLYGKLDRRGIKSCIDRHIKSEC